LINLQHTEIYLCLDSNSVTQELTEILAQKNIRYSIIGRNSLRKFLSAADLKILHASLVLDHDTFSLIWPGDKTIDLSLYDNIFITLDENQIKKFQNSKIPANISFLPASYNGSLLFFYIENELRKSKERKVLKKDKAAYKSLFENSPKPVLCFNPENGYIHTANKAAEGIFQVSLSELIGSDFFNYYSDKKDVIKESLKELISSAGKPAKLKLTLNGEQLRELEYVFNVVEIENEKFASAYIEDVAGKERSDELFYQQHEILRNTLESIDDLLFTLDKKGNFTGYFQPDSGTQVSLPGDVFVGKNIKDVGFPDFVAKKYIETITRVISEDKTEQLDYYIEAFGSKLWYNARIAPRKSVFGIPEGVTVLCRDVTRQKRGEETIKRARDFYLTLLTDFPTMIWKTNASKQADYFNKTWLDFTGNDLENEMQKDWVEKLHMKDVSGFLSTLLKAYKEKTTFQSEHRLKHKSGEYRWVFNVGSPFYNLDGHFAGFIGSCYDITERRKAEEMLNLQKSAMESALEGILIIDAEVETYPVIYSNSELAKITGRSRESIVGMDFMKVIGEPLNNQVILEIESALKTKKSFKGEINCTNGDKEESWRLLYMSPVNDKLNGISHFVAVLSDITESKVVENILREKNSELQKTNAELDRFVYSTSHELRSPLMSVLGLLNLLESEQEDSVDKQNTSEQGNYLKMIRDAISRLDKIIHDIIDYSRNSRLEVVYENIDFQSSIEFAIQNNQHIHGMEKIKFIIDVNNKVPFFSDKKRIEIIFNNVISNCIKFHNLDQENPFVEIKIKTSPVNALITLNDNGSGIADKHIPRLYDMFYRGSEKGAGSGIGLYIVKEIIDRLKGNIRVHSALNKGTCFNIDLPNYFVKDQLIPSVASFHSDYL
jgi:PAS domain S-box-containing protein